MQALTTAAVRGMHVPTYRLHKPSGQAIVGFDGRTIYLGKFGSAESEQLYREVIDEWRKLPAVHKPRGPKPSADRAAACLPAPSDPPKCIGQSVNPRTDLVPLEQLAEAAWLPEKPAKSTLHAWHRHGRRGVYLECLRICGRLYSTEAALLIFLAQGATPNPDPVNLTISSTSHRAAVAFLESAGFGLSSSSNGGVPRLPH